MPKPPPKPPRNGRSLRQQAGRYLSLGLQMVGFVLLCTWAGHSLDTWLATERPYYTAGAALFGTLGAMVYLIRHTQSPS